MTGLVAVDAADLVVVLDEVDTRAGRPAAVLGAAGRLREAVAPTLWSPPPPEAALPDPGGTGPEPGHIERPSAGNRRGELVTGGWVIDSGRRRPTRSGQPAVVWVLSAEGRARTGALA